MALRALDRIGIRRLVLVERDLTAPQPPMGALPGVELRRLTEDDVGAVVVLRPSLDAGAVCRRFDAGHIAIGAWDGDRLVSAVWFSLGEAWIPELDRRLELASGQAFGYDSFTAPDWRGRGVASYRSTFAARVLTTLGQHHAVGFIMVHNRSSRRSSLKSGYRPFGTIGRVRIGPWRRDFLRVEGRRRWVAPDATLDVLSRRAAR